MKNRKHMLKQIKYVVKAGAFALLFLSLGACDKEDEPSINSTSFQPYSDQGNNLKLTYSDGKVEDIGGQSVIGWTSGHLLGNNFYRQVHGGGSGREFWMRISIPPDTDKSEIIGVKLELNLNRLYLQNSTTINLYPELYIIEANFDPYTNAIGKIIIIETDSYDIIGEVDAEIKDIDGKTVKITGFFWKKNAQSWSH